MTQSTLSVGEALTQFLLYMQANGRTPKTISTYKRRLASFINLHSDKPVEQIRPFIIDNWLNELMERQTLYENHPLRPPVTQPLSPTTINGYKQAIKAFFNFCLVRGYITHSPAQHVQKTAVRKRQRLRKRIMLQSDLALLMSEAKSRAEQGNPLYLTLLTLMVESGARAGEIVTLTLDNLDIGKGEAIVNGKTGERPIPFGRRSRDALQTWLTFRSQLLDLYQRPDNGYVFVRTIPTQDVGKALSVHGLGSILRRMGDKVGVEGVCSPHAIRHLVADHMARYAPLHLVKELLGHADIATTMIYTHPDMDQIRGIIAVHGLLNSL